MTRQMLVLFSLGLTTSSAQTPAPDLPSARSSTPSFGVATIKPNKMGGMAMIRPLGNGIHATNVTLLNLIANAYDNPRVTGTPGWAGSETYDLEARMDGPDADASHALNRELQAQLLDRMLQSLLADRCHLMVHRESRQVPAYELVLSKNVSGLKPAMSKDPDLPNGTLRMTRGKITGQGVSMVRLATLLAGQLARPVLDRTGLADTYDFTVQWDVEDDPAASAAASAGLRASPTPAGADGPQIVAAVQTQLGLKLEPSSSSGEVIVVDRVERPTPN